MPHCVCCLIYSIMNAIAEALQRYPLPEVTPIHCFSLAIWQTMKAKLPYEIKNIRTIFTGFEMEKDPHTSLVFLARGQTQTCSQGKKKFLLFTHGTYPLLSPVLLRAKDKLNRSHFNLHNGICPSTPPGVDSYDLGFAVIRCLHIPSDSIACTQCLARRSKP